MELPTSLLVISRDFSIYDAVKRSSLPGDTSLFFCQPDEDIIAVVRDNGIRTALIDAPKAGPDAAPLLKKLKRHDPLIDVVILGDELGPEAILDWIHKGATDHIRKPVQAGSIAGVLERIAGRRALRRETFQLEKKLEQKYVFQGMVSRNPTMLEVFALIENFARHFSAVLITGETGTGKEGAARAIHALSPYKDRPLVVCDCAAIPENLFESELFGYRKGAFTGRTGTSAGCSRRRTRASSSSTRSPRSPRPSSRSCCGSWRITNSVPWARPRTWRSRSG